MKQSWEIKSISDVCEVIAGQSPKGKYYNDKGDGLPFYQGKKLFGEKYLDEPNTWSSVTTKESYAGDIVMSVRAPVGDVNFNYHKIICIGRGLAGIRAGETVNKDYLFYFLIHHKNKIVGNTGAVFNSINKSQIEAIPIPIPPLDEQKRIVAKLDECFEAIDKARANVDKNLNNAKELFQSQLNQIFSQKGEGWVEKKLGDITTILGDGLHGTPKYTIDGEYYFINGNNLDNGKIIYKNRTKRVSFEEYEKYKKNLNDRTVFVSINGTLGNVAFYNNEKVILGKSACYFNLTEQADKNFIKYVILSPYFIDYAHKVATGATIKNVSLKSMRELKINLPKIEEQNEIVILLDTLQAQTQSLESNYQQELDALDELKKSILQKAFNGEL
jgi:type I restriction enzyme S subunit